ncbi:MAG: hypothetical protein ACETWG_03360 [Candidatus Neomarinimicrobiota bacterium]
MFRSLLIILLGGLVIWLIFRLTRTLKEVLPGESRKRPSALEDRKIIDAEFEDVTKEESEKDE